MAVAFIGEEFVVNTETGFSQFEGDLARLSDGRIVAVWQNSTDFRLRDGINARILHPSGSESVAEFKINDRKVDAPGGWSEPAVAALSDGRFVVTWTDFTQRLGDTQNGAIHARVMNGDGTVATPEFRINTATASVQAASSVAALSDGRFVVTWTDWSQSGGDTSDYAIRGRIFKADGTPFAPEFLVPDLTVRAQTQSSVAVLTDGRFLVTWTDNSNNLLDGTDTQIAGRIFSADGAPQGGQFVIYNDGPGLPFSTQDQSKVTALSGGRFIVTFTDNNRGVSADTEGEHISARIYGAGGSAGPVFLVNSTTRSPGGAFTRDQSDSDVTELSDGRILVTWTDRSGIVTGMGDTKDDAVRGRVLGPDGTPAGPDFLINTTFDRSQNQSSVVALSDGRFMVSWTDQSNFGVEVRAQIIDPDGRIITEGPDWYIGLAGADQVDGLGGGDRLDGRGGGDTLLGGSGDDTLTGGAGADSLNGGPGSDVVHIDFTPNAVRIDLSLGVGTGGDAEGDRYAEIEGVILGYTDDTVIGQNGAGRFVLGAGNDYAEGRGGNDTLIGGSGNDTMLGGLGADFMKDDGNSGDVLIGDGPLTSSPFAKAIQRLYVATLDRGPDDAGWRGWTTALEGGQSLVSIAGGFVGSGEFQAKYGSLNNTQFVTQIYLNVLDREPDAGGLAANVAALDGGLSRTQLVVNFSESQEFKDALLGERHAGQVWRLYDATLNRAPDASGFEGWTDAMAGGRGLASIAGGFVGSPEFQATYGSLSDAGFVNLLYQNVLGRSAGQGELNDWLALMTRPLNPLGRVDVVLGFSESAENIAANRGAVDGFVRTVMTDWSDTIAGGSQLTGGRGSDRYVFKAEEGPQATVHGFESFDTLELTGFGFATPAQALAAMTQVGADVRLTYNPNGVLITFADTQFATLQSLPAQGWVLG